MATTKSVLVTGCSDGGLGSAIALTFAQRGLLVFATARNTAKMSKLANLPNVRLLTLDVTKPEDVRAAVASVKKETGGLLDFLVNNAGQARYVPMLDENPDAGPAKELFELNVWSQLRMVQEFAPLLMKAKGTAVYISSLSGYLNNPYNGAFLSGTSTIMTANEPSQVFMALPKGQRRSCSMRCVLKWRHSASAL
jgi:1-acylglycerone phosphate reductase